MENSEKLIKDIYGFVWMFNNCHDIYSSWPTPLSTDTLEIAPIVKNYCETIMSARSETSKVVRDAIDNIYKYCRPENYTESHMNKLYPEKSDRLISSPRSYASSILEDIKELIDAAESEGDTDLQELNTEWCHKWIFFNGDESGQQIIRINKIHYVTDEYSDHPQLAFDGSMIKFLNENNSEEGVGVGVTEVENYKFGNLYYIGYISEPYDDADDDEEWSDPKKLEAALRSVPIDTDMTSRVILESEVKEMISTWIESGIEEKCYDI